MHGLVQKILGTCERVANKFLHPGANYTYMYNLHTVCKSAHVNGALLCFRKAFFCNFTDLKNAESRKWNRLPLKYLSSCNPSRSVAAQLPRGKTEGPYACD